MRPYSEKHVERPEPDLEDFSLSQRGFPHLVRTPDIFLPSRSPPLGLSVENKSSTGFWDRKEVEELHLYEEG